MKYLFRFVALVFIIPILLISLLRNLISSSYRFVVYGGEVLISNAQTKNTIADLFNLIENKDTL